MSGACNGTLAKTVACALPATKARSLSLHGWPLALSFCAPCALRFDDLMQAMGDED